MDVGASIGIFSLYASQKVGASGRVVAFEPEPVSFKALTENVEAAKARNVTLFNQAVSDESGLGKLSYHGLLSSSSLHKTSSSSVDVETVRLDHVLSASHVDILKIDTEGGALEILEGAGNLLRSVDNIVIELHPNRGENPQLIAALLQENGFRTKLTHHYGLTPYLYATRDPNVEFPVVETWQIVTIAGIVGLLVLVKR